jgi:hypothetical protein
MNSRTFVRNAGMAGGAMVISPGFDYQNPAGQDNYPLMDLHVHTTQSHTIDKIKDFNNFMYPFTNTHNDENY